LTRLLRSSVVGRVHVDSGTRALYATDASNYRQVPLAVVLPRSVDDVVATVAACREVGAALVTRGGGTSMAGQDLGTGVVVDTSRHLDRIIDVDPRRRLARVEPGVILDDLRAAAAPYGLTFGPDPSSHSRCTLGGMIGNNACGAHSVAWGTTADNVERLEVLLYDGTRLKVGATPRTELDQLTGLGGRVGSVYAGLNELTRRHLALIRQRMPPFPRRVSGYSLDRLLPEHGFQVAQALVGSEGTCATVLEATVRLVPLPAARVLLVLGFPDTFAAADAAPAILPHRPLTVEGINDQLVGSLPKAVWGSPRDVLPGGNAWLLVEMGGEDAGEAATRATDVTKALGIGSAITARIVTEPSEQTVLWRIRTDGAGLATRMPDGSEAWPGWEDAAVPPERLSMYLRDFQALLHRHGRRGLVYGHFGEGCLHVRIDFDLQSEHGVAAFRRFVEEAADLVVAHGGSVSGEHGDGQARSELLPRMYGAEGVRAFEEFKAIWDPDDRMNPGVVVRPYRLDENLRFGPGSTRRELRTEFGYPHDGGSFEQAVRRCVGVGKCRQTTGGVMCPSYMVTREEKHSTRGRAHLLAEMIRGEVIRDGWRSAEVRDALDLCLSCKGCKSDCPVNVDMATYKAEFLHHHYAGRIRPASHYSMGWLPLWSRGCAVAPHLINAAAGSRLVAPLIRRLGGIAPQRRLPEFAPEPFTRWFRRRHGPGDQGKPPVLLWPDTFNNYLTPRVAKAATEVLEAAGFQVVLPPRGVCCGLTWISTGQLVMARRVLRRTLRLLDDTVAAGVPVVGLEPSCTAALRTDLPELLPTDAAAQLARRTLTLAEFLTEHAPHWRPTPLNRSSITQMHCHQHAVMGFAADERLLDRVGVRNRTLDSGCCGLAGNFGFERGHYQISKACGERVLLPAVRAADPETLVLADGFSCRTQIAQETGREALHLAELLQMALDDMRSVSS
jgi:FAD/FMN-containing dehydrogenase/Fe-S oxidoreductase